ncbi:MAG: hypothetical protein JXA18_05700 [Chitinispirillaceae bacterium]|nr:hypothetical protein [Chitinispirillaceae bacterium]
MPRDVVQKVMQWVDNNDLCVREKNEYFEMAKQYQRGETMSPVEEKKIAQVIAEMEISTGSEYDARQR